MLATANYGNGRKRVKTKFKRTRTKRKRSDLDFGIKKSIRQNKTKYFAFRDDLVQELTCKFWQSEFPGLQGRQTFIFALDQSFKCYVDEFEPRMRNQPSPYEILLSFCICLLQPIVTFVLVYNLILYFYPHSDKVQLSIVVLTLEYLIGYHFIHLYDSRFWSICCSMENFVKYCYHDAKCYISDIKAKFRQALENIGLAKRPNENFSLVLVDSDSDCDSIYECDCAINHNNITLNKMYFS